MPDSNKSADYIGKVIDGRYEILEKIANGGMATVYKALDKRLDRVIAIKLMHPHLANGPDGASFLAKFRREAKAAAKLRSPGIVIVHDHGVDDSIGYLTMEYVEGINLRSRIRDLGTFTIGDSLKIIKDILYALSDAHRIGLVHRDIKPENILINKQGRLQITDFGLARTVTDSSITATNTVFGTVSYIAPELIEAGEADARSDVYSVGIMLYELITGKQPYEGTTPIQLAFKHVNEDVPHITSIFPQVPNKLSLLIDVFCSRDENKRPENAIDALDKVVKLAKELTIAECLVQLPRPELPKKNSDPDVSMSSVQSAIAANTKNDDANGAKAADILVSPQGVDRELEDISSPDNQNTEAIESTFLSNSNAENNTNDDVNKKFVTDSNEEWKPFSSDVIITPAKHILNEKTRVMTEQDATPTSQIPRKGQFLNSPESSSNSINQSNETVNKPKMSLKKKRIILLSCLGVSIAILIAVIIWWYEMFGPGSYITVPYGISHTSVKNAEQILSQANVNYSEEEEYSDTVPKNDVIATDPESGKSISKFGKGVKIVVSKGIRTVDIPDEIVGQDSEKVVKQLKDLGFDNIQKLEHAYSTTVAKNSIISITPEQGEKNIAHNAEVKIVVSDGPRPLDMPNLVGVNIDIALQTLAQDGLKYARTDVYSDDVPAGYIISQGVPSGETVYEDDTITLTVSKGSEFVAMPNLVGQRVEDAKAALSSIGLNFTITGSPILGFVQQQSVAFGTKIKRGETITITIV